MSRFYLLLPTVICRHRLPQNLQVERKKVKMTIRFSDLVGSSADAAAQYGFAITNGDGDIMADFRTSRLAIGGSASLASTVANEIEASVMAALSAGIVANYGADSSFDVQEFDVVYSGDTLQITNREGRALAVEFLVVMMET